MTEVMFADAKVTQQEGLGVTVSCIEFLQNGRMTLGASTRSATAPSLPEMCDAGCRAPTKIGLLSPSDPLQTAYGNTTKSGALYTGAPVVIIPSLPDCAPAG